MWNKFYVSLSEDFRHIEGLNEKTIEKKIIQCISDLLLNMGKDISAYDLPIRSMDIDYCTNMTKEIEDELKILTVQSRKN